MNHETNWQENLLTDRQEIEKLLRESRRIAVLGIRPARYPSKPAYYVPAYLASIGLEVLPVPVVDRDEASILGQTVYTDLASIPGPVDIVDVFRRAEDIPAHIPDILAKMPRAVWFQSGIRNAAAAEELARAGILVVQDRCLMVDFRTLR